MPKFRYKAITNENKIVKGIYIANDENDLKEIIANQKWYYISSKKIAESSQLFSFLEKINIDDFTIFCRQFAIMINAGMNINDTVLTLSKTSKNRKLRNILDFTYNNMQKGEMLSDCFDKYPKTFPSFFRNMIRIGEKSGRLDIVFNRLADYYSNDSKSKKQIKSALAYPIFLICIAFAALAVISIFVMPKFKDVFDNFDAELPTISIVVMDVSNFIRNNFSQIVLVIFSVILFFYLIGKIKKVRYFYDYLKLNFPILREINLAIITSRFANSFAVLLSSGLQLLDCIDIVSKSIGNLVIEERLQTVKNEISIGRPISKSLETINTFPPVLIEMIAVGEKTGTLEDVLNRVTSYFDDDLSSKLKKVTSSIEPIMIIFIGLIVVVVLLAIFLPMLDLMNAIDNVA